MPRPAGDIRVLTQDRMLHRHKRFTLTVEVCLWGAHWWSRGAGGPFAVLGAGAGLGHGRTVGLLPLEEKTELSVAVQGEQSKG